MLIKTVIVSAEYGKEEKMLPSDILNSNLKMCSIPDHSKMYAFGSVIFKLQSRGVCQENCVFPSVFVHMLSSDCGLQLWISCGSQDCELVVFPGV